MIHYIDQTSERDHHMVFNSSILKMLMIMYPNEEIVCHGILSNQESTKQLLDSEELKKITFKSIEYTKALSENKFLKAINYIRKERKRKKLFKELLLTTTQKDLIFLSITTFTSFAVFKKLKTKFDVPTIAVLHGDLDFVYNAKTRVEKLIGSSYKKVFKTKAPNFYYLILNKISKAYVVNDGYLREDEIFEINHPYNMMENAVAQKDIFNKKTYSFGHIGSMEVERKNSHFLYVLAERCNRFVTENKISFQVIGLITPSILPYKNKWVEEMVGNKQADKPDYLSREDYESKLASLDYSIFFYDENQYIFRASGAIIDAIAFTIPFVVLEHPIFNYIFKEAGNVGFKCKDLEEMENLMQKIIAKDVVILDQYNNQIANLIEYRKKLSVKYIADDLEKQLNLIPSLKNRKTLQ